MKNTIVHLGVSALAVAWVSLGTPASAQEVSSRPVLFVHGFNPLGLGEDCKGIWGEAEQQLAARGFTGQMVTLGYYGDDPNCDVMSSPHGSILTKIEDLSHDFAWTLYNGWSSKQSHVDLVAHSLGGLIVRYALYRVAVGDSTFPPFLIVDHIVTVGSPYTGYSLLAESCYVNPLNVQCWEMAPYSKFIAELRQPQALLPQGAGGTLWTNIGSNADIIDSSDGVVGSRSATSMNIPPSRKATLPWYKLIFHTEYYHNSLAIDRIGDGLLATAQEAEAGGAVGEEAETSPASGLCTALRASLGASAGPSSSASLANADLTGIPVPVLSHEEIATDFSKQPVCLRPGRLAPNLTAGGERQGVVVSQIRPSGLFDRMGLLNGDVLMGCDADTVNRPFDAIESIALSSKPGKVSFCVLRGGHVLSREFSVEAP